ncbi:peptide-methionine (S)-S-oxide reductase MsrA [Metamycoplasma buccale]|uniref:peptide-methionine (S)-S-oxide reductase MsrA n=1 Tax=Metamycoplasma buccale TaxID=55602 RepID=UPI00398F507C
MSKKIYVAGGCFWGVQAYLKKINGVIKTQVGYANSKIKNPSYELVKAHVTDAVEAVEVIYDENFLKLETIVEKIFSVIDPTAKDYQGPDYGRQYRNGFYYVNEEDKETLEKTISYLAKNIKGQIATEIMKLQNFYLAEEYHQDYVDKHPETICHIKF